jgi:two-component system, NarL family, response regulator LiaR
MSSPRGGAVHRRPHEGGVAHARHVLGMEPDEHAVWVCADLARSLHAYDDEQGLPWATFGLPETPWMPRPCGERPTCPHLVIGGPRPPRTVIRGDHGNHLVEEDVPSKGRRRTGTMTIRILIADDHQIVRQGLRLLLKLDRDLEVVGEAEDGAEAVRLARQLRPDLVLMDLLMPEMDGVTATAAIRQEVPEAAVLVLTSVREDRGVVDAMRAGAIGYLLKDVHADALRRAIKAAAAGQIQLSPEASAILLREVRGPARPESLTERETAVLRLLTAGKANKEIAQELQIGETTVKSHVRHILAKLGAESRTQAALHAVRSGLVVGAAPA